MITLIATPGAADANSYVSLAEAQQILGQMPEREAGAFLSLSVTEQSQWLVAATDEIDLLPWDGDRTTSTQARAWPCSGVQKAGSYAYFEPTEVPVFVKKAQCLMSLALRNENATDAFPVSAFSNAGSSVQYDLSRPGRASLRNRVHQMVAPYVTFVRLERA
jgi:hypothetical protein